MHFALPESARQPWLGSRGAFFSGVAFFSELGCLQACWEAVSQPRGGRNWAPQLLPPCQGPDLGEQQHRPHLMALTKLGGRQAVLVLVVPWLGSIGVPAGSRVPHPLGISCLSHVYLGCPAWGRCQCLPLNFPRHRSPAWPCPELIPALLGSSPKFLRDRGERTIKVQEQPLVNATLPPEGKDPFFPSPAPISSFLGLLLAKTRSLSSFFSISP